MNDLIERYVYSVTKRLDDKKKKDIENELKANIYDMLGDDLSEENTIKVLKQLGKPSVLALEFKDKKAYVISPEIYDDYIRVLKIVVGVLVGLALFGSVLDVMFSLAGVQVKSDLFDDLFGGLFDSALMGFAVVTIIFWAIDRYKKKETSFDPKALSKVPLNINDKNRRTEYIIEFVFLVIFGGFFLSLLITNQLNLNFSIESSNFTFNGQILNKAFVSNILPVVMISFGASIVFSIYKIAKSRITMKSFLIYGVIDLITIIVATIITMTMTVLDGAFINELALLFELPVSQIVTYGNRIIYSTILVVWTIWLIDQIVTYLMLRKASKQVK